MTWCVELAHARTRSHLRPHLRSNTFTTLPPPRPQAISAIDDMLAQASEAARTELQREVQAWASNTHKQRHTNHPFLSILNALSTMHALARTHARTCACSQARNAETRKEAAVSKMEQANMDLARLKSSAARSAAMQQKEYEMRYEALRTKVQESEKQVREG